MNYKNLYTGRGDKGTTDLYLSGRVNKTDIRIITVGQIDKFHASLGLCWQHFDYNIPFEGKVLDGFKSIQTKLFTLMGEIVLDPLDSVLFQRKHKPTNQIDVEELKSFYDIIAEEIDKYSVGGRGWTVYGEQGAAAAQLDYTTTICREVELQILRLGENGGNVSEEIKVFFNLLSKILYLLARYQGLMVR